MYLIILTLFSIKIRLLKFIGIQTCFYQVYIQEPRSAEQFSHYKESWHCVSISPLNAESNPICYLLALLAHHFLHVSRIRVKSLTLRLLMSYIYIYGAPFLDVSRSYTTTQHSRQDSSGRVISSSQRPLPDNTRHSQQTNIHAPGGFEPKISAGERPQAARLGNSTLHTAVINTYIPRVLTVSACEDHIAFTKHSYFFFAHEIACHCNGDCVLLVRKKTSSSSYEDLAQVVPSSCFNSKLPLKLK